MKTQQQINKRISEINREIERINEIIHAGTDCSEWFTDTDGKTWPEESYQDALTGNIAKLSILYWFLSE